MKIVSERQWKHLDGTSTCAKFLYRTPQRDKLKRDVISFLFPFMLLSHGLFPFRVARNLKVSFIL